LRLGLVYHALGDYGRAIDVLAGITTSLDDDLSNQYFGGLGFASVRSAQWLALCFAELGEFARGVTPGQEAIRIAEAIGEPWSLVAAHGGLGYLYLRKGDLPSAISILERGWEVSQSAQLPLFSSNVAS